MEPVSPALFQQPVAGRGASSAAFPANLRSWRHISRLDTLPTHPGRPCTSWGFCHRWAEDRSGDPAGTGPGAPLQLPVLLRTGEGSPGTLARTISGLVQPQQTEIPAKKTKSQQPTLKRRLEEKRPWVHLGS